MKSAKIRIFEQLAGLARVLGHAYRLELLEHVSQGGRSVENLARLIGQSIANTSAHLQQLRRGGFVETQRDGKRIIYRLSDGPVIPLLAALRIYGERNRTDVRDLVSEYFEKLDRFEPLSREELTKRIAKRSVTLLDVRPDDEFALGHLPGAINMPLAELKRRLGELPKNREIVAYCRGAYCIMSFEAVAVLRAKGYRGRRLEDGFPEWKAAGLAVEATA
ncbi:MAG: ArsR family transcriptional regulator [Alphaproteobacteria bacterium]|jgi:rhodanese-related sulfurtransferase/DNA-binding HxlR family transcriptional regulator|nr:ArsR family transcriptional regulator [Alphaproteobacteria bacterium]